MSQENLTGFINPGTPSLFTMPKMPTSSSAKRKSSTTNKDDDEITAMYGHTLTYEMAKSRLSMERMSSNAQLQKILKDKYSGDTSSFIQDPEVQQIMSDYSIKKASLAASKNSIELEYKNYEKARSEMESKNAGDKYATGNSGQRLFIGPDNRIYDEGTREGQKIKKEDRAYMTNNQLLDYNRKNLQVTQDENGMYQVQTGQWSDPADFTKDAVGDFVYKHLGKSASQYDSEGNLVTEASTPGGQGYLTNVNRKWNIENLGKMNQWVQGNIPAEAKKQLMQRAWENNVFDTDLRSIKAPKLKEDGSYATDKNGNVIFEDTIQYTSPEMIEKLKEKEKAGTLQPWEKEWLNGDNQVSDQYKFAKYTSDVARNYAEGLTSDLYTQRFSKDGSGSDSQNNALMTKEGAYHAMLFTDAADLNKMSVFTPTGKTDSEGNQTYEKKDMIGRSVKLQGNSMMEVLAQNENYQERFIDEDGNVQKGKLNKAVDLSTITDNFIWNNQAFKISDLKGAKILGREPVVVGAPKMQVDDYGNPILTASSSSSGELGRDEMQSYFVYEIIVPASEAEFFENNGIEQKGGYDASKGDDEYIRGTDIDSNAGLGWWGFQDSEEARALGIEEQSVDGALRGDMIRVKVMVPANSTAINFHGDMTKDRTNKANYQNLSMLGPTNREREEYEADNTARYYEGVQ